MSFMDKFRKESAFKQKPKPASFMKRVHSKNVCKDCSGSYYYDVVRCPICSSSNLEIIKMEVMK